MNFHDEDEFLDDQVMPDLEKWQKQEQSQQQQQQKPRPSVWRLVALVNGEKVEMEKVEAYSEKQAIYKLCFDLETKDKNGNHPIKEGWKKAYATLKRFIKTHKKENLWVVNKSEEEKIMKDNNEKNINEVNVNQEKEANNMDKQRKDINEIVEKANAMAKETVAQKAVAQQQSISETRAAYEAELAEKDALVTTNVTGNATIQNNQFKVRVLKDEKKAHSYSIVDENGIKVAVFSWGKALLPNITVLRNDEFGIDFVRLSSYQEGEDLKVSDDYASLAAIIFGSEESFRKQLVAEQNRLVDEQELVAQRKSAREEFFATRNVEQMEAAVKREEERQANLAAAKEAWKASELVNFVSVYEGKEIALVARYLKSVDDKGNEVVKAIFAHRGTQKAFARLSWNTYFGGPMLTVVMKDSIWAYERDKEGKPIVDESGKPKVKWSKVERKHELHMNKSGDIVKKGAYNKEVQVTEVEKNTYLCICNGLATALGLPQPGPKAARYPVSDEEFFAGLEDSPVKPFRRI